MPLSALPDHLKDVENHFPDDDQYGTSVFGRVYRWFHKTTKTWFAFSYRCPEWWAKWRKTPIVLFAVKGDGAWHFERSFGPEWHQDAYRYSIEQGEKSGFYLSRIQSTTPWHFAIQWPFMIHAHFYFRKKLVFVYGPMHFDADLIYWLLSFFVGTVWK